MGVLIWMGEGVDVFVVLSWDLFLGGWEFNGSPGK